MTSDMLSQGAALPNHMLMQVPRKPYKAVLLSIIALRALLLIASLFITFTALRCTKYCLSGTGRV